MLSEAMAEVVRQEKIEEARQAALQKKLRALQAQRNADLELSISYMEAASLDDSDMVMAIVKTAYLSHLTCITMSITWLEHYFGDSETFLCCGVVDECLGAALAGMYYYPNRYNLLIEYFPDAIAASIIAFLGDEMLNIMGKDWSEGFHLSDHAFHSRVSLTEMHG